LESIKPIGEPLSAANRWAERYVLAQPLQTMCQLRKAFKENLDSEKKPFPSLGIIKPSEIFDLKVEEDTRDWNEEQLAALTQLNLFRNNKPLEKIPYRFVYHFNYGAPECQGHHMSITDWELGVLYLGERERLKDEQKAVASVKRKFMVDLCGADKDTYFFVGNTYMVYDAWIVLGVFYPPKEEAPSHSQPSLFC